MDQKEIVWHGMEELPPHVTKTASKTVIVKKKSGRIFRAYYIFPEETWVLAKNGQKIPKNSLKALKHPQANYMDDEQKKEDEEQAAYLAEWSEKHNRRNKRTLWRK